MAKRLIILTLTLLIALSPTLLQAQSDRHGHTGAEVLAMPESEDMLQALDDFIRIQTNPDTLSKYITIQHNIANKLKNKKFIVRSLMSRGYAFGRMDEYHKAVKAYEEALTYAKKYDDRSSIANCYNEMATNLSHTNDYNRASECFNNALHVFVELGDTIMITDVYRNMGRQCLNFHLYKTANSYFDNAFKLDSLAGDNMALGLDFYNVGKSYYFQYLDLDSIALLRSGINNMMIALSLIRKAPNNKRMLQGCYEQLMLMYICFHAGDHHEYYKISRDSAHYYYNLTNEIRLELNPSSEHMILEISKANFLSMDGNYADALRALRNLEDKFEQGGSKYARYKTYLFRSMIWTLRSSGDYKQAVEYSEKFKVAEESTYNREFAVKSIKASAETEYSEIIRKREETERQQEQIQREQIKRQRMLTIFFIICIVLAIILVAVIWKSLERKRRNNELLAKQKAEILQKNNELQIQNQKIESQRDEIMAQRDEIEAQRTQLSEANSRITASIRYAQRIQTASVPSDDMMQKIFGECMVYWKPLNIVSGDFFWATQAGRYKLLTAADCTGHGVPGAFMSMLGVSTLNDIAAQKDIEGATMTAASVLEELRSKIIAALRQSGPQRETQDGIDMAFCIIDNNHMQLQYAGANRPLWIVRDGELTEYKPDRMPVGYHVKKDTPFTNTIIDTKPGDTIYLSSDGLANQFGGSGSKSKFSTKQLRELLASIATQPFKEQLATIEKTFHDWRLKPDGSLEAQLDDQILVGIRI